MGQARSPTAVPDLPGTQVTCRKKRYFHYPMEEVAGDENEQQKHDACNGVPEKSGLPHLRGVGEVAFEEDDWELRIVADEDEHLEE